MFSTTKQNIGMYVCIAMLKMLIVLNIFLFYPECLKRNNLL